jgi:hypothetical protein
VYASVCVDVTAQKGYTLTLTIKGGSSFGILNDKTLWENVQVNYPRNGWAVMGTHFFQLHNLTFLC